MTEDPSPSSIFDPRAAGDAPPPEELLRPLKFVCVAVISGAVMMTVVRAFVDPEPVLPSMTAIVVTLACVALATAGITVAGYSAPALPLGLTQEQAWRTSMRYFASTTIARAALSEAPVVVAFVLSFAVEPRSWLLLLVALPAALGLFWWHVWPSARTAAAVEVGLESEGADSHLSETLGFR